MLGQWTVGINIDLVGRLGGKGAGLFKMQQMGLPVPPAFVIAVNACHAYHGRGRRFLSEELCREVMQRVSEVEAIAGKRYGNPGNPLLLSVRSGAPVSMPGMMDTILNVGINDSVRNGLETLTGNPAFAWDCHRRFLEMLGETVFGIEKEVFRSARRGTNGSDWRATVGRYQELVSEAAARSPYPQVVDDVEQQLLACIEAVLKSWQNDRAVRYRKMFKISADLGTAVVVQAMVFGNLDGNSGTGVVFTRDPSTGVRELVGEYLVGRQGEEVVSGEAEETSKTMTSLRQEFPLIHHQLARMCRFLEFVARDVQDIEFTFEQGKLYILQTRSAKRTPLAAVRFLADAVAEGLLSQDDALRRARSITKASLEEFLSQEVTRKGDGHCWIVARGRGVTPRVTRGRLVFSTAEAIELSSTGDSVVMVRDVTSPEDIGGIEKAAGLFTARGGPLSHAAVVCRELGKPCVVGTGVRIDIQSGEVVGEGGVSVKRGELVTVDGTTGLVWGGHVEVEKRELDLNLVGWIQRIVGRSLC